MELSLQLGDTVHILEMYEGKFEYGLCQTREAVAVTY